MSRPSAAESVELQRLESLSALVSAIQAAVGILSLRMRQIRRRARGDQRLEAVVAPAVDELARIADGADDMYELLRLIHVDKQAERTARDRGHDAGSTEG